MRCGKGSAAQTELQDLFAAWDARYHEADGILATLRVSDVTGVQLGQLLRAALGPQLTTPVVALLEATAPLRQTLGLFITELQGMVTELQNRLTNLLLGPNSLGGIRDALQELVQRVQDFNLDFLQDSLASLFDNVRSKLDAINPANLKQVVEEAFDELLATLDINQVIPSGDVAQLDADYAALIDKLRTLDPETLVTNIIQPAYEEAVIPLLDNFDVTALLDTIIARLRALDDELRQEMERVNQAYQAMLQAVPPISLGVEISSPF
jgi:hypothetical protein